MSSEPDSIVVIVPPEPEPVVIEVGIQGPPGSSGNNHINQMVDVDTADLADGAIMAWDAVNQVWKPVLSLRGILDDGGNF